MDIELTERNWRLAAKIVLVELKIKERELKRKMTENRNVFFDYEGSNLASIDEYELEALQTAIKSLEALLL